MNDNGGHLAILSGTGHTGGGQQQEQQSHWNVSTKTQHQIVSIDGHEIYGLEEGLEEEIIMRVACADTRYFPWAATVCGHRMYDETATQDKLKLMTGKRRAVPKI